MTNIKYETKRKYYLTRVNTIFNRLQELEGDRSQIIMSTYEPSGDTGVTIKLKANKPDGYTHNKWTWENGTFTRSVCDVIATQRKTDDQKSTTVTLYDGKYLMSSRYAPLVDDVSEYIEGILEEFSEDIDVVMEEEIKRMVPTFI